MSVYVPPATGQNGGGCSGGCATESQLTYNYVASYFNAHAFTVSSYRYEFITWIALGIVIAIIAAFHHSGIADQTWLGALWSRWAIKNRVIKYGRKSVSTNRDTFSNAKTDSGRRAGLLQDLKRPSRKVFTVPSFSRTLLLAALVVVPIVLTIVGADYIRPTAGVFDMSESWPKTGISIFTPGLSKRLEWGIGAYPRVTTQPPTITLPYRTWWTAGSRAGAMTNALTPLIVVIALKQIPFALLSTRLLGGFSFDRLSFMHKWGGRIVWLFATAHVALWCVQMSKDTAFQRTMWAFIFVWTKFRWGFVAYGFFTLLIALSIGPIRERFYEFFYITHVVCVIGFMVAAWLHHPPAGYWMYVTLLWWAAERITRAIKAAWVNGIGFTGRRAKVVVSSHDAKSARNLSISDTSSHTLHQHHPSYHQSKYDHYSGDSHLEKSSSFGVDRRQQKVMYGEEAMTGQGDHIAQREMEVPPSQQRYTLTDETVVTSKDYGYAETKRLSPPQSVDNYSSSDYDDQTGANAYRHKQQQQYHRPTQHQSQQSQPMSQGFSMSTIASTTAGPRPAMAADVAAVLRPGFAYAQLLPGKTLRLTLRTPNKFAWLPGQYINLCIPKAGFWQTHPFTIASAYNAGFPSSTLFTDDDDMERGLVDKAEGEERTIVLLVRARRGFTLQLWEHVRKEREKQIRAIEEQTGQQYIRGEVAKTMTGVHVRALIDGPYGSIQRVRWHVHSTIVIICGGSGISSGMSILEHLCSVMAGNRQVKNFQVQRVRFVWMLREYAHLQWIASALRRCIEMVPPELLQVELFVTKIDRQALQQRSRPAPSPNASSLGLNGAASSAHRKSPYAHSTMTTSDSMSMHQGSYEEGGYDYARFTEGDDQEEYEIDATDLTEFAGEDNSGPSVAEVKIGERVAKEGKLRRALTRKATAKRAQGRIGRGQAPSNRPDMASRNFSALAHQRSVHESSRRPQNDTVMSYRGASPIPERDLGEDQNKEEKEEWEDRSTAYAATSNETPIQPLSLSSQNAYRSADGFLNPNNLQHPLEQRQNSGSSTPSRSHSPQPSPSYRTLHLPSDGRRTPGANTISSYRTLHQGQEISSSIHLNASSNHDLPSTNNQTIHPSNNDADTPIDLDQEEYADLRVLAELARPGYPKLDVILREEASHSTGRVLISACGPLTLGNLIRSVASKQINVGQIRKGHLNSHINVITESYEWGG